MKRLTRCILSGMALLAASANVAAYDAGPSVYNSKCIICHGSGVAGAPKTGDHTAWQPRIEQGMDVLLVSVVNGKGNMPPRGMCPECSDSDLVDAIQFMISQ
ncbi:MAG TPA: c-type cytochrome [Gammaproteobacteria bacterium]|nr:c-type cytochrome [Gammaproteobacteria bacterium]